MSIIYDNLKKELEEEAKPNIQTFKKNFDEHFEELFHGLPTREEIRSMKELSDVMEEIGVRYRRIFVDKNGNSAVLQFYKSAEIQRRYVKYAVVLENGMNNNNAPLSIYDIDRGIYTKDTTLMERLTLKLEPRASSNARKEVIKQLQITSERIHKCSKKHLIPLKNGILNLKKMKLLPFSSDLVFITTTNTNYNPNAKKPVYASGWDIDDWFMEIADNDKDKYENIYRVIRNSFTLECKKAVFLYSEKGSTGKGTFIELLINMIGRGNHATANLRQLSDRWTNASIYGNRLVTGDENDSYNNLTKAENFKSLVTGDPVFVEAKGEQPFNSILEVMIVQAMNSTPQFEKISHAEMRRILLMLFNKSYEGAEHNPLVKEEYMKDNQLHEYLLLKALELESAKYVETEESKVILEDMELQRNHVKRFWLELGEEWESTRLPIRALYRAFVAWLHNQGHKKTFTQQSFTRELKKIIRDNWEYDRKNKAPLNYFKLSDDKEKFDNIQAFFTWTDEDMKRYQPLLIRK